MQKVGIVQYSQDMEVLGHFASVREAQNAYGISHVSAVCRRQRRSDGGYIWRYDDDESPFDFSREHWEAANPDKLEDVGIIKRKKYRHASAKTGKLPGQGGNLVVGQTRKPEFLTESTRNLVPEAESGHFRDGEDYLVRVMRNYELILRTIRKTPE